MKLIKRRLKIRKNNGWKAITWDGNRTKKESLCILEIAPGKSLVHIHLLSNMHEYEIILEGVATYEGAISGVFKFGDILEQKGKSGLIKIKNKGRKPLKILCINRPPWNVKHEKILSK